MKVYDTQRPDERDQGIAAAAAGARRGDLVVLPTDTLYGLGCDAFKQHAVAALFRAKGRGRDMPLVVMVGSRRTFDGLVHRMPKPARALADAFWPGALTIIVEHAKTLTWDLGDTDGTVAVRMPLHPVALEVLREVGPMAVSSANKTGQPPAVTVEQAREQLGYAARVYLDGGPCPASVPSAIVDLTGEAPRLLRAGALAVPQLREVLPDLLVPDELAADTARTDADAAADDAGTAGTAQAPDPAPASAEG
ncbi:MAG: threonylcarbamoyl-AMP synthase [Micromonosporaceae bacterium]|nr:threonylcarbamoyl-AMP synthase [Micromonosporaceae bacterium]